MKKESPRTRRNERDRMWYAHRLEGKVRNVGIKPKKKKKKRKSIPTDSRTSSPGK